MLLSRGEEFVRAGSLLARALDVMAHPSRAASLIVLLCVGATRCHRAGEPTVAAAAAVATHTSGAPTQAPANSAGAMPHGDHSPHHGGIVYMYDDLHYEVVLEPGGHHRLYFSDASREDLPASVASNVTLTIEGPRHPREKLTGVIDPQGESWVLDGVSVAGTDVTVRVAFVAKGDQYWIDVPFIASTR